MSTLAVFFDWLVNILLFGLFSPGRSSGAAKKLLAREGRVGSSIRAVEGRVLNMGTEWSMGVVELSPGHLRFLPSIGIVGTREIDVLDLHMATLPVKDVPATVSISELLRVTTASGDLYWLVPIDLVDQIVDRLRPPFGFSE